MKIALVISQMGPGGAERVMSIMATHFAGENHEVTLITIGKVQSIYQLHPNVRILEMDLARPSPTVIHSFVNVIRRARKLAGILKKEQPAIVISFMTECNLITILAAKSSKLPVIVSERSNPWRNPISKFTSLLRTRLYKRADALVVQSDLTRDYYQKNLQTDNVHVIFNPIVLSQFTQIANKRPSGQDPKIIVNIGRLSEEKGQDVLIRAFSESQAPANGWKLWIIGGGHLKEHLQQLADSLGMNSNVQLLGNQKDVKEFLQQASLFILSSRFEGFPNALLEAMASGVPSISTDCETGPSDIITNGENGILVPVDDVKALSSAINKAISDDELCNKMISNGLDSVKNLSHIKIMQNWEQLIRQVVSGKSHF